MIVGGSKLLTISRVGLFIMFIILKIKIGIIVTSFVDLGYGQNCDKIPVGEAINDR
ncbi:hypothetical protein NBRC116493_12230 [Aurantivibrio infirmus]